jgi:REP element-mobilizing transposase RayT
MARFYRRHLPHGAPDNAPVFVTWNLKGALPKEALDRIDRARKAIENMIGKNGSGETPTNHADAQLTVARQVFKISEEFLDAARHGPQWLREPSCAETVMQTILAGAGKHYDLYAFVVMSNHVHVLLRPKVELARITAGIKRTTGKKINECLNRVGQPFWQDESFDHRPRDSEKFMKALAYIENNPVKAGLCRRPEDWPWSSASMRSLWPQGTALAVGRDSGPTLGLK